MSSHPKTRDKVSSDLTAEAVIDCNVFRILTLGEYMDPRVELIRSVITNRNNARLSARQAGSLVGICEGHFLRLFKQEAGTTFRQYKREARINGAVSLLTDCTMAVKQIAGIAGYEDVSNFHRDFKLVQGVSPRQWRLTEFRKRSQRLKG
jgi:AraC-like DNA-binding protein